MLRIYVVVAPVPVFSSGTIVRSRINANARAQEVFLVGVWWAAQLEGKPHIFTSNFPWFSMEAVAILRI